MMLKSQKRLSADIMKCSAKRIVFDNEHLEDIKEAITKADIKGLINRGTIKRIPARGVSRARARMRTAQRRKGRQKGFGTRKGKSTARLPRKTAWMNKIRLQRAFLCELREKGHVSRENHKSLYRKSKGGFFRSKRHLKLYAEEHGLIGKQGAAKKEGKDEK